MYILHCVDLAATTLNPFDNESDDNDTEDIADGVATEDNAVAAAQEEIVHLDELVLLQAVLLSQ